MVVKSYLASLNSGLHLAMEENERVHIFGEDILDPYGGPFKVEKGLSTRFPTRVHSTPISEAAFTGVATGMALGGFRPVVSIMFGDFLTLIFDQVLNHMAKFGTMYGKKIDVPIVVRAPSGGGRGYGATHSQSLEKHFMGIPDLEIWSPSCFHSAGGILHKLILETSNPVLFIESKVLYAAPLLDSSRTLHVETSAASSSVIVRNFMTGEPDVTIVAYGGVSLMLERLMCDYIEEEINITLVLPAKIAPLDPTAIIDEALRSKRALVIEDGTEGFSWGSEVSSLIYDRCYRQLKAPVKRLTSDAAVIPCCHDGEELVLITSKKIENALMELLLW